MRFSRNNLIEKTAYLENDLRSPPIIFRHLYIKLCRGGGGAGRLLTHCGLHPLEIRVH